MKTTILRLILLSFLVLPLLSYGQTRKLSGTVVAFQKFPLNKITVKAKKAKTEAQTNENGEFEIEVRNNDVIKIKEPTFLEYTQKITEETEPLKINLIFDNTKKNVETAVAAGFLSKDDLEYGLEHLFRDNSVYGNFSDAYQAIKYALPECSIIYENGKKGIQFRGPKTIVGSNVPLKLSANTLSKPSISSP